jgi:hypothetical protein
MRRPPSRSRTGNQLPYCSPRGATLKAHAPRRDWIQQKPIVGLTASVVFVYGTPLAACERVGAPRFGFPSTIISVPEIR